MERVVQTYKYEGFKHTDLFQRVLKLREEYPNSEFFINATHNNTDYENGFHGVDEDTVGSVQDIHGRLMLFSDLRDDTVLVHCNPWGTGDYEYYGYYKNRTDNYQIAGPEFSDPKQYGERECLWVENHEIDSYEMHYFPRSNKEAALLLTRLEDD